MNQVRLDLGRNIEGSGPEAHIPKDAFEDHKELFVLSPETVELLGHQRQIAFHGQEWMLSDGMPPQQAVIHREQYELHSAASAAILAGMATAASGAEVIPFPVTISASEQFAQMAA